MKLSLPSPPLSLPESEPGERRTLTAYRLAERVPFGIGRLAFSGAMRLAAPYFVTIPATIESAEPGSGLAGPAVAMASSSVAYSSGATPAPSTASSHASSRSRRISPSAYHASGLNQWIVTRICAASCAAR